MMRQRPSIFIYDRKWMKPVPGMLSSTLARAELGPEKSIETILSVRGAPCEDQDSRLVTRSTKVSRR